MTSPRSGLLPQFVKWFYLIDQKLSHWQHSFTCSLFRPISKSLHGLIAQSMACQIYFSVPYITVFGLFAYHWRRPISLSENQRTHFRALHLHSRSILFIANFLLSHRPRHFISGIHYDLSPLRYRPLSSCAIIFAEARLEARLVLSSRSS